MLVASATAQASLVTNGDFSAGGAGWTTSGTTGVTFSGGQARIGQPGTPGDAYLSQSLAVPTGNSTIAVSFDYLWQETAPANDDTFSVTLDYLSGAGAQSITLLQQLSSAGDFSPPLNTFNGVASLVDAIGPATLTFHLNEVNSPVGTRIHLDNVVANVVPEASTLAIWSTLLVGGLFAGRKAVAGRKAIA
jgi:hypothetical protein